MGAKTNKKAVASPVMMRLMLVFFVLLIIPVAVVFQLLRLQFIEGEALRQLWEQQATDFISIPAERGAILDAGGRILATNVVSYSVAVDPLAPRVKERDELAQITQILEHFTSRRASYYDRMIEEAGDGARYIVLGRQFQREVHDSLRAHGFRSLILEEDYRRHYNLNGLAAQVLGYVNHYMTGTMGLEAYYNPYLKGTDGIQEVRKDSRNRIREYVGAPKRRPEQGHNLVTTIDARIQAIVEEELSDGLSRTGARQGSVIVVEPGTGKIRAMVSLPSFNPNTPGLFPSEQRRNLPVTDMIEPGSTFKLVTAVAALEQNKVTLDEIFETPESGEELIQGQWMRDHNPLGTLSFRQAIEKSSNVAVSRVARRIQPEVFYQYVRNMGFGTTTGIDLPGEESGKLQRPFDWSGVTQAWMSVGYEVQTTPLQLTMAYAALANGGKLMRPFVVERIVDGQDQTLMEQQPAVLRQAFQSETAELLRPVFENVVSDEGTARFAALAEMSIAGKTGTAQKYIDGRYRSRYRASFVGFYPSDKPEYVALVLLDEPSSSIYGGVTAGPIFRNIARRSMALGEKQFAESAPLVQTNPDAEQRMPDVRGLQLSRAESILRHRQLEYQVEGLEERLETGSYYVAAQMPDAGQLVSSADMPAIIQLKQNNSSGLSESDAANELSNTVPDVVGMSMRQAIRILRESGYQISRRGSGTIAAQFPEAGSVMQAGREVLLRGRTPDMNQLTSRDAEQAESASPPAETPEETGDEDF